MTDVPSKLARVQTSPLPQEKSGEETLDSRRLRRNMFGKLKKAVMFMCLF